MDASLLSALSALGGAIIGGLTSLLASFFAQRSQARVQWISQDRTRRQEVYKEFIDEASKCYADALQHDEADIPELVNLFATISRRLVGQADDQQGALTVASRSQSHHAIER